MKKVFNALWAVLFSAAIIMSAVSCAADDASEPVTDSVAKPKPIPVTKINMKTEESVFIGASVTLTTTFEPANANQTKLVWDSDNTDIATVDQTGKITSKAIGSAVITATAPSGVQASCTVTVGAIKVSNLDINYTGGQQIYVDETLQIIPEITPENATDKSLTYSSSDSEVASVTEDGLVTGLKAGSATITVTANGGPKNRTFDVTVRSKPYPVIDFSAPGGNYSKDHNRLAGYPGFSKQLSATMSDSSESTYTWKSNDESVAKVDDDGKVTFIGVSGSDYNSASTVITCTAANGEATSVNIRSSIVTEFKLEGSGFNESWMYYNRTYSALVNSDIKFILYYNSATTGAMRITDGAADITISSSNTDVAEVVTPNPTDSDSTSKITTKAAGETVISVVSGSYNHSFTLRVTDISGLAIDKKELNLLKGNTEQITATVNPESASNKTVLWSSANESVATVDSTGLVTATGIGETEITAVCEGDNSKTQKCRVTVTAKAVPVFDYRQWGYSNNSDYNEVTAYPGAVAHIVATMNDGSDSAYTYSTDIPDYVHIADDGTVTFTGENVANNNTFAVTGTITITSVSTGESVTVNVKVSVHGELSIPRGWGQYGDTYNVKTGQTFGCEVMYSAGIKYGGGCQRIPVADYTAVSSDTSIATVAVNPSNSTELLVTGIKPGQVTISINVNGVEKFFYINVTD